jgi:acetylornithine aminotransferase
MQNALMPNYVPQPVAFVKGKGAKLWDTQGKEYLDALSGIAVCGLGHAHPTVTAAISEQAQQLLHTSNLYTIPHQQNLAAELVRISGMETAFFCNSGAEANEAALKITRLYGHNLGIEKPTVVVTEKSFHGRTLATLTATGNPKVQAGFAPLLEGFIRVPYNNVNAIAKVIKQHPEVVAVLVEPVIGEGGIIIPADDYLVKLRDLCDKHNCLLMLDEIQTGMGRTGQWFAYQHTKIMPDVLTLAKSLGNGVPIGACLGRGKAADILQPGTHGSTFGGNPLACRAALAVIETLEKQQLPQRAQELGEYFYQKLVRNLESVTTVRDIRVKGLMIGIELNKSCAQLVTKALEQGLLINVTAEKVIRLLPPLILSNQEADEIINILSNLIRKF